MAAIAEIWDATNTSRTGEESNAVARSLPDCNGYNYQQDIQQVGEEVTIAFVSTDKYTSKEINPESTDFPSAPATVYGDVLPIETD